MQSLKQIFVSILGGMLFMAWPHIAASQAQSDPPSHSHTDKLQNTGQPQNTDKSQETDQPQTVVKVDVKIDTDGFVFDYPDGIQSDLPQMKARATRKKTSKTPLFNLDFLAPVFKLIFYALLVAAVLYILYQVAMSISINRRSRAPKLDTDETPDLPTYRPDAKQARVLLDDADKLAAQGLYEEAVHLLLYRSIQDIEKRRPHHVRRSLTAREIAGLPILSAKAKESFALIGRLVENSYFGGRTLDADDYARSKEAYKKFAFEKVGGDSNS